MTRSLKIQRDVVALEAFSITTPTQLVKNVFPRISKGFNTFLDKISFNSKNIQLDLDTKKFLKQVDATNFLDVSVMPVQAPEGFKSGMMYTDYSKALLSTTELLYDIEDKLLDPFSIYVAKLISSTEHKFDTSNYFQHLHNLGNEINSSFDTLGTYFSSDNKDKKLGDVLSRNADWSDIIDNTAKANELMNKVNLTKLNKKITEISSYLDVLAKKTEKGELENVSKEVVKSISEGTYQIATILQYFTSLQYQLMAFNNSIEETAKRIYNT